METKSKILLIDDEEVVLDSCSQILAGGPYEVASASNGTSGLNLVQEFHPDLVFVDLKMPGISGFDVLEKINQLDSTIVTVVITGYATVSSAVEAMKKGAYDFLPKPFMPDEFRLITRRSLEKRRLVLETIALRREKEILRENFAAIVSHELKSPLGAIQQNIFVLEQELSGTLNEAQHGRLERIKIRVDDLVRLINSWLRVISVDIGKLREHFVPISVESVVTAAIESAEPLAKRKNIEIDACVTEALRPLMGDRVSLTEALVNILGNAVKYSHDGSKVNINVNQGEHNLFIIISDSGVGIAKEDLPHIFDGFFRGKAGYAEGGHGIGLAISKQIIEAHDGSITVDSELGKGTTFIINLPTVNVSASASSEDKAVMQP